MKYFAYSQKEFVYKYVVMLSDVDQFKHMSFANYLKLMFLATDALFIHYVKSSFLHANRLTLLNSRMQFKHQCTAGDNILIKVNSANIKGDEFVLLYTFVIEGTGDLVGLGRQSYAIRKMEKTTGNAVKPEGMLKNVLDPILVDEEHLLYKY